MEQRNCIGCGVPFIRTVQAAQRYCTTACRTRTIDQRKKANHTRSCDWCGKQFNCLPHGKQRHCSKQCAHNTRRTGASSPLPWKQCRECGATFYAREGAELCGDACRAKRRQAHWARDNARRASLIPTHTYTCNRCGKTYTRRGRIPPGYCSQRCANKDRKRTYRHIRRAGGGQAFTLRYIAERDGWRCHLCGKKVPDVEWTGQPADPTLDHLIPVSAGGRHTPNNVALSHFRCNSLRSDHGAAQLRLVG